MHDEMINGIKHRSAEPTTGPFAPSLDEVGRRIYEPQSRPPEARDYDQNLRLRRDWLAAHNENRR